MKKIIFDEVEAREFVQELQSSGTFVIDIFQNVDKSFVVQWVEHKKYIAHDGKEEYDEIWTNKNGEIVLVQDMDAEYARNALRSVLRQARYFTETLSHATASATSHTETGVEAGTIIDSTEALYPYNAKTLH